MCKEKFEIVRVENQQEFEIVTTYVLVPQGGHCYKV